MRDKRPQVRDARDERGKTNKACPKPLSDPSSPPWRPSRILRRNTTTLAALQDLRFRLSAPEVCKGPPMSSMLSSMWSEAMASSGDTFDPTLSPTKFQEVLKNFIGTNPDVLGQGEIPYGKRTIAKFMVNSARSRPSGKYSMVDLFEILWMPLEKLVLGMQSPE